MAKTAKEVGIRFGGHVPDERRTAARASRWARRRSITSTATSSTSTAGAKAVDDKALQDLVLRTRKAGAWIVPTMVVWETLQGPVTLESRTGLARAALHAGHQVAQWTKALETRLKNPQFNAAQAKLHIDNRMKHPEGAARRRREACCSAATRRSSSTCPASRSTAR